MVLVAQVSGSACAAGVADVAQSPAWLAGGRPQRPVAADRGWVVGKRGGRDRLKSRRAGDPPGVSDRAVQPIATCSSSSADWRCSSLFRSWSSDLRRTPTLSTARRCWRSRLTGSSGRRRRGWSPACAIRLGEARGNERMLEQAGLEIDPSEVSVKKPSAVYAVFESGHPIGAESIPQRFCWSSTCSKRC